MTYLKTQTRNNFIYGTVFAAGISNISRYVSNSFCKFSSIINNYNGKLLIDHDYILLIVLRIWRYYAVFPIFLFACCYIIKAGRI